MTESPETPMSDPVPSEEGAPEAPTAPDEGGGDGGDDGGDE
jgi:hypothetical protein